MIAFNISNNQINTKKSAISFQAGLSQQMAYEIKQVNVSEVSKRLAHKGIPNSFQDNKIVAWSSEKTVDIVEQINKQFKLKLPLPTAIYVDDFKNLNIDDQFARGFCNVTPNEIWKNSEETAEDGAIFFNNFQSIRETLPEDQKWLYNWNAINDISSFYGEKKYYSTNHFLEVFLHEFMHNIHTKRLASIFGGEETLNKINTMLEEKNLIKFQDEYAEKLSRICLSAAKNPFESVAYDMSGVFIKALDKKDLTIKRNPFINTPYENFVIKKQKEPLYKINKNSTLKEILKSFWDGQFE